LRDEICREHGFDPLSHQLHIHGISPEGRGDGASVAPASTATAVCPVGEMDVP